MSAPDNAVVYQFDGATFYREVSDNWPQWFPAGVEYTQDRVLSSSQDYVDVGATTYGPLQMRAILFSRATQTALAGKQGITATLENNLGYSQEATLVNTAIIGSASKNIFYVDLTFIWRPVGST